LHRREVLKLLALGPALPALSPDLLAAFRAIHTSLGPTSALMVLSSHQDATVTAMGELILPRTDTPGAKDARVNEFIDRILADWYSDRERAHFLAGLADVDSRTRNLFSQNFVDASPSQQAEILRVLGEELAEATAALANAPRGYRGETPIPENNFYLMFRDLTLTGYFTSEAGFTQQLQEEIIPGRYDGCVPFPASAPTKGA
jgi:glucoside 3-dehydrogenase (cytochrome c) hitch-hiker subunit